MFGIDWHFVLWAFVVVVIVIVVISNPAHYGALVGNAIDAVFVFLRTLITSATG